MFYLNLTIWGLLNCAPALTMWTQGLKKGREERISWTGHWKLQLSAPTHNKINAEMQYICIYLNQESEYESPLEMPYRVAGHVLSLWISLQSLL